LSIFQRADKISGCLLVSIASVISSREGAYACGGVHLEEHHGHFDRVLIIRVDSAFRVDEIIEGDVATYDHTVSSRDPSSEITALTASEFE
jgi:hypothetical protein